MCPVNPSHVFQDFHTFSHAQARQSKKPNSSASASAEAASQAGGAVQESQRLEWYTLSQRFASHMELREVRDCDERERSVLLEAFAAGTLDKQVMGQASALQWHPLQKLRQGEPRLHLRAIVLLRFC